MPKKAKFKPIKFKKIKTIIRKKLPSGKVIATIKRVGRPKKRRVF